MDADYWEAKAEEAQKLAADNYTLALDWMKKHDAAHKERDAARESFVALNRDYQEAQKEVERLRLKHQANTYDHEGVEVQACDACTKAEVALQESEARAARMRDLLHLLVRSLHGYDEHRWDQQVADALLTEGETKR